MPWEFIEDIMALISFLVTLGIGAFIIYKHIKAHWPSKSIPNPNEESLTIESRDQSNFRENMIHLYDLRQFKYRGFEDLQKLNFSAFFIDENENEALGIFVSVSPTIMATLTKLEKALIHTDMAVSDADVSDVEIIDKIKIINDSLSTLLDVTDIMSQKLYAIYSQSSAETTERELNPEVVKVYIDIVNNMVGFAFDYLNVNNIIRLKVKEVHPHVERDFVRATEKFLNIFFVDLMNCINMLDKSIEAYE